MINREIAIVNRELAAWTTANRVMLLDLAPRLAPGGELDMRYSYDGLHLNAEGYRVWRDCLAPLLNGDVVPGLQRRLRS